LVVFLVAPIGTFLFGLSLDLGVVYVPLMVSGALAIAWNLFSIRVLRSESGASPMRNPVGETS
ncbi:MAG: hypothetical protein ACKOIA_12595, partial [Acidimicrobiia bacterium]